MKRILLTIFIAAAIATPLAVQARAQAVCIDDLTKRWENFHKLSDDISKRQLESFLKFKQASNCMSALILSASKPDLISVARINAAIAATKKSFQQNGASVGSGGTTNLVARGATAQILAIAAEYGALTETSNGQTATVQGQLGAIPAALVSNGAVADCSGILLSGKNCVSSNLINQLNRLSYSVSFDIGTGSQNIAGAAGSAATTTAQPATFTAAGHSINSVTGKAVLVRGAAASATDMKKALDALAAKATADNLGAGVAVAGLALSKYGDDDSKETHDWADKTLKLIEDAVTPGDAVARWQSQGDSLIQAVCKDSSDAECEANLAKLVANYALAVNSYHVDEGLFFESLRKKPVMTAEYDYNRPVSAPTNSTFRLIYGQTVGTGWTLTANAATSIYNSTPSTAIPGSSLLRDLQFAAEASYDFSKGKRLLLIGNSTASTAYYFQDQTSPAILNVTPGEPVPGVTFVGLPAAATQVYAQKGKINIFQGKFTYIPGVANVTVPISVTWSNRTELVTNTNSIWRGQIGISYDFDSLFGGIGK